MINDMESFEKLSQFEVVDRYWSGGFDGNIQDVGIIIQNINTGVKYDAGYAYFDHGIDEYFINEDELMIFEE